MSSPHTLSSVAFIGLGTMGLPMARNLAGKLPASSARLYVYDIVEDFMEKLWNSCDEDEKGRVVKCKSALEAVEKADVVLTMVPEGKHVHSLYLDSRTGLVNTSLQDKLLIDCSTIDTATSIVVKEVLAKQYPLAKFYDAPVSGGSTGAEKATLTFMLGCSEQDPNMPILKELLSMMGSSITACGGHSLGLTAKLCNNYCSGLIAIATAETFNIAIRSGLDPRVLHDIFRSSTAGSCINEKWNPVPRVVAEAPSSREYAPGFKVELMAKDFGLAVDIARDVGARLILAEKGLEAYKAASADEKCRGKDSRVVYRWLGGVEDWEGRSKEQL